MRHTPALERLAGEIETADRLRLSADPAKVHEWAGLAAQVVHEATSEWLGEAAFRLRTGAHRKWCARNYARCERAGTARRDPKGRREWHVSARPPRAQPKDAEGRVKEIVESFAA